MNPGKRYLSRRAVLQAAGYGAVAAAIAACAPGIVSSPSAPAASTSGSAAASAAASGAASAATDLSGQKGVLWGLKYDPHVAAYKRLADLFNKQTGATLEVVPVDWPIPPKLIASIAAGEQPDVVCGLGSVLTGLYQQKALMPLTKDVYQAGGVDPKTAFLGDAIPAFTFRGEIYGVPVETSGGGSMVNVPVDDVRAAGLQNQYPPTNGKTYFESYESMWELAKRLQVKKGDKVTKWGLSSKTSELSGLLGIIRSQGVDWWDGNSKQFHFDTEAGIKAFQLFAETPVKLGIETELDQSAVEATLAGKVALCRGDGTPAVTGKALGYNYELCGAPSVNPGKDPLFVGEGGWGFIAPRTSKNPALSIAFLRMMATKEGQFEYAKIYDGLLNIAWAEFATDTSRFSDPSPDSPLQRAAPIFTSLIKQTVHYGEEYGDTSELSSALGGLLSNIRLGKLTSVDAAREMQVRAAAQYEAWLKANAEFGA